MKYALGNGGFSLSRLQTSKESTRCFIPDYFQSSSRAASKAAP